MLRSLASAVVLVALPLSTTACSMTYRPADGPRASLVMKDGKPAVIKEGREYEVGFLGGGLEDALGNDPAARQQAEDFHDGMVSGFVEAMGGGLGLVAGVSLVSADAAKCVDAQPRCDSQPLLTAGLISLGAGLVLYTVGLVTMLRAQPHMYDAINVYNDHVEQREGHFAESRTSSPAGSETTDAPAAPGK
jgi:hypothetical protein